MTRHELKTTRESMGLNIRQMAERLNTPRGTYVKWENEDRRVPGFLDVLLPILGKGTLPPDIQRVVDAAQKWRLNRFNTHNLIELSNAVDALEE